MPPRRAPPRGGAAKKDVPVQKDKINTSTTSTRTTRATKRAASQAACEAPEPLPSSSQEATLPTTPKKRASRAKTATAKKSGNIVENATSTFEPDNEEPAEAPIPTPKLANKTRGKAKAEVHPGQPTTTRQTRGKKSTIEPEPKPADNGTKKRATRNNINGEKAEKNANVPKPKTRATAAKRDHVVAADEEILNDATQGTPKLRKVEPGPVSNSRRSEQEEAGTKHRKPRQKKAASPLPINDPFLEQTAPIEEAQQTAPIEGEQQTAPIEEARQTAPIEGEQQTAPIEEAQTAAPPKGRPARGKKAAAGPVQQEAVDTAPEPVQSNARSLRARKAQPLPTPNVQRSSRAKVDKGKGKAVDPQPVVSQNGAVKDFPAQQQEVNEHTVENAAIPKRRGRPPKVAVVVQAEEHAEVDQRIVEEATIPKGRGRKQKAAAAVKVEENIEVNPHPEEEPITLAKPGRARRITKAAEKTPVRRSGRRNQAAEQPEAEGSGGSRAVAVVIEKIVVGGVAGVTAMREATDEVVERKAPVAKTNGKKAAEPVEEDSDQEAKQAIKAQPDQQSMEHPEENLEEESGKGTGSSQAEIGIMAGEVNNVSVPVAPDITATTEESPFASTPANKDSQHDVDEDNALPPTFSQTPIPAPVLFSPSRTTQSFSEPTKSPTPVPSSPLARFSSPAAKPIVGSRKRDFDDDDVTPRSPPVKRSRSNPSTPLASSSRTTSSSAELNTPNQLSRESTSYTPKATIKHLDISSSPVLHPPRNLDEGENPGKSPIKNATPRSSLDLASMHLVGSVESNRWAGDSPSRRSRGVSPMKKQNMSFTEVGETKSQAEDGVGNGDEDAGAQTEEDSELQQNESKETVGQLTLSKDQMASEFKVETGVTEKEALGTQVGTEEYTSPAQVDADNDSELEDSGAMDQHQQENTHPEDDQEEDDQEEAFVDDSTFNNDSLFAIPAEDIPVEGAERSQTENVDQEEAFIGDSTFNNDSLFAIPAEDIPVEGAAGNQTQNAEENVVENVAENENTNAADQLNDQSIDAMNAHLPSAAQEYYEDTIEIINESSLMLRRDMNDIRSRTPTLGGFYQRTSLRETDPSNLSGIFAPGLQLSDTSFLRANTSLVPADTSDSFTFDYSAIQRELEANNTIEAKSGLSPIQENENGEADSQASYEDMLPDYLTADSNFNTSQRPNNSSLIASSPMSESAIARTISFFGEDSVLEDSRAENNIGWDDQSLVEPSGGFDEEPSQDEPANETEDGQKSDESPEEDQDSLQSAVQNEGSLSSAGYSRENVQEHDGDDEEDTIRNPKPDNEAGDNEDTIRVLTERNEVKGDEHTITGPEEDDDITITISNAVVESVTTSQESIFTDGPPKESFSTNSGSFESKSSSMDQALGSPANVTREAANKNVDSLLDASMTVSTPEVNRTHKFSLPPRFTPTSTSKRSLADSSTKKGTSNALNMSPYGMKFEDIPDFDDDFSVIESTPSDRKTPATEQKWITPAGSNTPQHLFSSPSKPKSLTSKLLQEENFDFTDDFSFIEDEKEGANNGKDVADRGENNEKIRSQPGESGKPKSYLSKLLQEENFDFTDDFSFIEDEEEGANKGKEVAGRGENNEKTRSQGESAGRISPVAPLGEVQIHAGPITLTHAAVVADTPTGKRKIGTLEPVSVKRGKYVSPSSRPIAIEVGDDTNEDISLIDVEDIIGDRKYIRPKGRRQSLRLSYLDSAASNTVSEPEPQSEVYLTPEKSRFQNLNPLFSACPDSVQAKRHGRRTSIGQRRASLQLEENAHVYTTIQAAVRGYICRKKLKEAHKRANEMPGEISDLGDVTTDKATVQRDLEMAAVVFVSAWKGLKQRRAYLIQRAAAVTIQRAYRKRQAAVSQSAKSAMSAISAGPFDGLLKRFDNKRAAETAAISEPESSLPVTQPVVNLYTPRPRRMATQSPVPEKYLYRDPNKYKRAISVEPELKAVAAPPTTSADDEVEPKARPTRALGSRIPRSGLRLPVASGMSSTSIGKRKAEDNINEPFVPRFKSTTASGIYGSNPFGKRKDSLSKMTQPEVNQLTTKHTERNRRYDIDFERKVVRVERDRSSSPDAKTQHRRALEDRMKRYEVQEETGIVLGPGDPMDYEPEIKTPTRKGVRWHADLEFGWDEDLEKNSPSAAKKKAKEGFNGIMRKQVPLDPFGNAVGPSPRISETPEKIVISKVLYTGEDDE